MNNKLSVDQIFDLKENSLLHGNSRKAIELLFDAINDWPKDVRTVEGFFVDVKNLLKVDDLTQKAIYKGLDYLNPTNYAWELEALNSLLEISKMDASKTIEQIIDVTIDRIVNGGSPSSL